MIFKNFILSSVVSGWKENIKDKGMGKNQVLTKLYCNNQLVSV